jgi:hypothetical protein
MLSLRQKMRAAPWIPECVGCIVTHVLRPWPFGSLTAEIYSLDFPAALALAHRARAAAAILARPAALIVRRPAGLADTAAVPLAPRTLAQRALAAAAIRAQPAADI